MYFRWKSLGLIALNKTHNVNSSLKFLRRQSRFSTPSICRLLCNVLIQPPFDYGCTAWFSNLSKNLRVTLQAMQNKCIRLSLQLGNIWRVCAKEILELNCLNVHDRYIQVIFLNYTTISVLTILMKFSAHLTIMKYSCAVVTKTLFYKLKLGMQSSSGKWGYLGQIWN